KFASDSTLLTIIGSLGSANGDFSSPSGICVDAGDNVYVADTDNHRIQLFTSSGVHQMSFGVNGSSDGQFIRPEGVGVAPGGEIFVADTGNHRIQRFDAGGAPLGWWGRDDLGVTGWHAVGSGRVSRAGSADLEFDSPKSVVHDGGNSLIIGDTGNNRVQVLSLLTGTATIIGTGGTQLGQFDYPTSVAVDGANFWVADYANHRAQQFSPIGAQLAARVPDTSGLNTSAERVAIDANTGLIYVSDLSEGVISVFQPDGSFVRRIGAWGTGPGQMREPRGLVFAADGTLWVADSGNGRLIRFTTDGTVLQTLGTFGTGDGQFRSPWAVEIASEGHLVVADTDNNRVQIFLPDGTFERSIGTPGSGNGQLDRPGGIAVSSDGRIYVADTGNARIQRFAWDGAYQGWWGADVGGGVGWHGTATAVTAQPDIGPCRFNAPTDLRVDDEGCVYVTDAVAGTLQKFSPQQSSEPLAGHILTLDLNTTNIRGTAISLSGQLVLTATDQWIRLFDPGLR
ncbi:MAG TPA: 6-bladed beta-propeller, partial [Candidatus Ozemobacteraceae bacterium]|nr:6-bladed beta-propeller [Candidatus Ozemobacteraceae bacterium]